MADQDQTPQTGNRSLDMCRRTVTTESFIAEAKEIYGDFYDYGKVEYKNRDHQVTVVCPIHGDFNIYAREHLDGKGCPKCEKGERFLAKLHEKFGDKFGLEQFVYESSTTPVTLICPKHGAFSRLPNQVLSSTFGCPECANQVREDARAAVEAKKAEEPFKRAVATQKRIDEFRAKYPEITNEGITNLVQNQYPDVFVDNEEVALEIIRELVRRREEYTEENFIQALIELYTGESLKNYTREIYERDRLYAKTKSFINYIYETAQDRTLYLSECEEYKDPKVKEYYENLCKQREKPLAKVLYSLLNVEAMHRTSDDVFVQGNYLQFHCYTEPNGDIVFTKNRRTRADYDADGRSLYNEEEIVRRDNNSQSKKSGCVSVIFIIIILAIGILLV